MKKHRAVSYHLNDPGELLKVVKECVEWMYDYPMSRPLIATNHKTGELLCVINLQRMGRRDAYVLGSVSYSMRKKSLTFSGGFFIDCEDEVREVCGQLGVKCKVRE